METLNINDIILSENTRYNYQNYENLESKKAEKLARKTKRLINNSYQGFKEILKKQRTKKLEELQERERIKKLENPKYKKKFKYELLAEMKEEAEKRTIRIEIPKQTEPRILYFDKVSRETVWNLAGKEQGRVLNEWIKVHNEKVRTEQLEKLEEKEKERLKKLKKKLERRKKKTEVELKKQRLTQELKKLEDGSYQLDNGRWKFIEKSDGYFTEIGSFNIGEWKLRKGEYAGVWHDKEDRNRLYIGISKWYQKQEEAEEAGRKATHNYPTGEKAIFDCKNKEEIRL